MVGTECYKGLALPHFQPHDHQAYEQNNTFMLYLSHKVYDYLKSNCI